MPMPRIAIRREDKSQERRSPVPPEIVPKLREAGLEVVVQGAPQRVFDAASYRDAGAEVVDDLTNEQLICGIKEIPIDLLEAGKTYVFFTHTIKGQPENMPLLARLMELGCTAIDYERIVDADNRRLVFFGRYAGLAGAIDTLWALGQRLAGDGHDTALAKLSSSLGYDSLADAEQAISTAGAALRDDSSLPDDLWPLVIGVSGTGNTAQGARQILDRFGAEEVSVDRLPTLRPGERAIYQCYFDVHHLVQRHDGRFDLAEYFAHPYRYDSIFDRHLPQLSVLLNCIYWNNPFPRICTIRDLNQLYRGATPPKLQVIGDVSCDIRGGVEATVKATWPDDPVYTFDPDTGEAQSGFNGPGPAIMAVYNLPAELPRDASLGFGEQLLPFLPAIAGADFSGALQDSGLPQEVQRAVIVHRGELTSDYEYLRQYLVG
jgi:saccharopine dehydrogenase (NAD+, L-lysine-forming)